MLFFFFNDTATTEIYTLSLHDALPISTHDNGFVVFYVCRERKVYRKNNLLRQVKSWCEVSL